jgi:ankyrin repeat protein
MRIFHGEKSASRDALPEEEIKTFCNQAQLEQKQLMEDSNLLRAAELGNEPMLRFLVSCGADLAKTTDQGKTALHCAALKGNIECVRWLLDAGANDKTKDAYGNSALHDAVYSRQADVVQLLIERGAEPSSQNKAGYTALHVSASEGYVAVTEILLQQGSDIEARSYGEQTALHLAVFGNHEHVVKLLLENGADLNAEGSHGQTPLHLALGTSNMSLKQLFVRAAICRSFENRNLIFSLAAEVGNEDTARLLLMRTRPRNCPTASSTKRPRAYRTIIARVGSRR